VSRLKDTLSRLEPIDAIPICFLAVWFYGLCVGIYNDWPLGFVFSNFAGMTIYSTYFILKIVPDINQRKIHHLIFYAVLANLVIILAISYPSIIHVWEKILNHSHRALYSVGSLIIFIPASVSMFLFINNEKVEDFFGADARFIDLKLSVFYLLSLYIIVYNTNSKGFLLGWIFLTGGLVAIRFLQGWFTESKLSNMEILKALVLASITLTVSINPVSIDPDKEDETTAPVENIFSPVEYGNSIRMEQIEWLINDLTFWGHGLGASIEGYQRHSEKTYGFEVIYLNLVHKFGVISIILFACYALTIFIILRNIWSKQNVKNSVISLGGMTYLIPSLGNPLLFHPLVVVLHVISLYLLTQHRDMKQ
jgi:hypothetical protein